jgi:murein DD-endopeptidase MepM/ murein hydrolase activator NlpD
MNSYVWAARSLILGAGAFLLIKGVLPDGAVFGPGSIDHASTELLYGESSPFRSLSDLAQEGALASNLSDGNGLQTVAIPESALPKEKNFEYTVKRGQSLAGVWREIGGSSADVDRVAAALKKAGVPIDSIKHGEEFTVKTKSGAILEVRKKLSPEATVILTADNANGYSARVERLAIKTREKRVTGVILSSLVDSAEGVSLPYSLVDDFVDLFSSRVEFRKDLQPGDSFTVVYEERYVESGDFREPGVIKAASLHLSGKMLAVVRDVAKDGSVRYFDEKGEMPTKAFLRYPVKYTRISSVFTHARFHPVLKIMRPHNGVDFAAPVGTPVRSVGDGVVVHSGYSPSGGNMVRILHDSRYTTEYMHLNSITKNAKKGARIGRGETLGTLGNTGLSSGPHLHYGLFDRGKYIDPMKAKVVLSSESGKPPAAVLAMIVELKKSHQGVAVASKRAGKNA